MSTSAQIEANQANAQKSTGPTSEAGKTASSQNRRTHGLSYVGGFFQVLPCEDQTDFTRLVVSFMQEYQPETATEQLLIQNLAQSQWLRDRALRLQDRCFNAETGEIDDAKKFSLYLRYYNAHNRAFHKCLADLLRQRKEKQNLKFGFEREKRNEQVHQMRQFREELEIAQLQNNENCLNPRKAPEQIVPNDQKAAA